VGTRRHVILARAHQTKRSRCSDGDQDGMSLLEAVDRGRLRCALAAIARLPVPQRGRSIGINWALRRCRGERPA